MLVQDLKQGGAQLDIQVLFMYNLGQVSTISTTAAYAPECIVYTNAM